MEGVWQRATKNVRFYVLVTTIGLSILVYLWARTTIDQGSLQIIRLTQIYGFLSVIYLYFSLLATPLTQALRFLPYRGQYIRARRAIGVSAFYFAWLHSLLAFFGQLQGFGGLGFLSSKYLLALGLGLAALIILTLMAATAFDLMVEKLSFPRWKWLHRTVYAAGILIIVHVVMLGTHFIDLSAAIPRISMGALILLLTLEAVRIDKFLNGKFPKLANIGIASMLSLHLVFLGLGFVIGKTTGGGSSGPLSLGIHAQHLQLARQAQQPSQPTGGGKPALTGDSTKRYTVSFIHPDSVDPNADTNLSFEVFDASSGNPPIGFLKLYDKVSHLVVVDNELTYYSHIHPDLNGNKFSVIAAFPHPGRYHLYLNYQPVGAIEQQVGFSLNVGQAEVAAATTPADSQLEKTFGNYKVKINSTNFKAAALSLGQDKVSFSLSDLSGQPVTNLKPYLAAFGHLVMINEQTYDYIHVHPNNTTPPPPDASGGPTVEFLPLGLYGPIKPGIYRVFAQFNPGGQLMLADFTVKVE